MVQDTQFHVDGGEYAALITLYGSGTWVLDKTPKFDSRYSPEDLWKITRSRTDYFEVPRGDTMFISATERSKRYPKAIATVHASPITKSPRIFLVIRFTRSGKRTVYTIKAPRPNE